MNQNHIQKMNEKEWKIDHRTAKELEARIEELAASYTPEWHFDRENPDIGSVIAKLFAHQMEGNIGRYNQVLSQYHTEFVNLLDISLLPAKPASATVLLKLIRDTIPGIEVAKGTQLLAESEDGDEQMIFETTHNLYVTSASLDYAFMTLQKSGQILPLKGSFLRPQLVEEESPIIYTKLPSFRLFESRKETIERNALLFYHSVAFDVEKNPIYLKICGNQSLLEKLKENVYRIYYYTDTGLTPVEEIEVQPDIETVILKKEKKNVPVRFEEKELSLFVIQAEEPVLEDKSIKGIFVSSEGEATAAEVVNNGSTDFDVDSFDLFGDTLSLFQECYIGHSEYFGKAKAVVRLTFQVSYLEHRILHQIQGEDESLKIIKRKPKTIWVDSAADARAEEISCEYFNGIGWKKLNCLQEVRYIFSKEQAGAYEISFVCPEDFQETEVGAYKGRCIRLRLLKSDNCYMRPCVHHYPHIEQLKVSYSYEGRYMEPQHLLSIAGTKRIDLTKKVKEGIAFTAFSRGEYREDALYLGFQKKMEEGPVSLLFQIEEGIRFEGSKCQFSYSTRTGFRQMKILDYTAELSRSGIVMFMPQADMYAIELEGKKAYWIRISRQPQARQDKKVLPVIKNICLNAVQAVNIESREEEDFYLEESTPDMAINLGVSDILDIELWVNEREQHTHAKMQKMLSEEKERVRAEYDIFGNISSFYVRWEESDQLEDTQSKRCYLLDRMNSRLIFGDGVHTALPSVLDDVAFKVRIRCCNGEKGNVGPGRIREAMGNLMFVDQIRNPVKAYGGSNIESMEQALQRGANILKSRRKLISEDDYIQEILNFSDAIAKVRCVTKDDALTFVILLKDFEAGSYSFYNVASTLKEHLKKQCELTIAPEDLSIVEPVFARVCVDLWVEVLHMDDGFEIQNLLKESLTTYLNPVSGQHGFGWEIGVLPRRSQILMKLHVLKSKAVIRKLVITVQYTSQSGTHEVDLEDIKYDPYLICCSGNHHVNILLAGAEVSLGN